MRPGLGNGQNGYPFALTCNTRIKCETISVSPVPSFFPVLQKITNHGRRKYRHAIRHDWTIIDSHVTGLVIVNAPCYRKWKELLQISKFLCMLEIRRILTGEDVSSFIHAPVVLQYVCMYVCRQILTQYFASFQTAIISRLSA